MKIDIIVSYVPRYRYGHELDFVPPLTGIHLAALTPSHHRVRVIHQQVEEVNLNSDADLIAISVFSGFALEAYRLAREFRERGKTVIAGGPHVTFCAEESLKHFNSIVIGEAESVWKRVLEDHENGNLQSSYSGKPMELSDIPTPKYDLLSEKFFIPKVVQATRGCPFSCSFCTVPQINPGYRLRPVDHVLKDAAVDRFKFWWQRKVVWFWDDNLASQRKYIKELLVKMIPFKKWWVTQASIDIAKDVELLDLMKKSGCIGVFFGIESFESGSLVDANKVQNKTLQYKDAVLALHKRGIAVMAGFIVGFDHDTDESIINIAGKLMELKIDVPFISILTPFRGTKLREKYEREGKILADRNWPFYNGYNVAFQPQNVSPDQLLSSHRALWKKAFSLTNSLLRIFHALFTLRFGAIFLSIFMNGFYCLKKLKKNYPLDMSNMYFI